MDESIINLLMDAVEQRLTTKLIDEIPADDESRAQLIQSGKLLEDPTLTNINLTVYPGDENWPHVINTVTSDGSGMYAPTGSFGDGYTEFWRRRFMVEMEFFYEGEPDYETARNKSNVVLSRAEVAVMKLIREEGMIGPDSFGEGALRIQIPKSYLHEGGGDGEFNWKGFLYVEALTERNLG